MSESIAPSLVTSTGPVYEHPGHALWATTDRALRTLRDLHLIATGRGTEAAGSIELSADEAFLAYSNLATALDAQLAVSPSSTNAVMLEEMCTVALDVGSLDGLEGPFLSAVRDAQEFGGAADILEQAGSVWSELGMPEVLGGGAQTTVIFDPSTSEISFAGKSDLQQLLGDGGLGNLPGITGRGRGPVMPDIGQGLKTSEEADRAQVGAAVCGFGGMVVGGLVGFFTAGPPGALVGAEYTGLFAGTTCAFIGVVTADSRPPHTTLAEPTHPVPDAGAPDSSTTPATTPATTPSSTSTPAPAPSGETGGMTGVSGTTAVGHAPVSSHESLEPDGVTGFGGQIPGLTIVGQTPTQIIDGPGMQAFVAQQHEGSVGLISLPAFDDSGKTLEPGFLSSLPAMIADIRSHLGDATSNDPTKPVVGTDGVVDVNAIIRGKLRLITIPPGKKIPWFNQGGGIPEPKPSPFTESS